MESPPPATAAMASQKGKALMGSLSCSLSPAAAAACSKEKTDGPSCQGLFCLMTSSKRHTRYPSDASPCLSCLLGVSVFYEAHLCVASLLCIR
eukprot:scaffold126262_cov20-Tisochrysis_lutea.AAC.1